ncbi:MAG TPA: sugar phosphate isomerase/epimerase family protein [Verrucomicrobiota bacterium]|jgi:hexulose-6-phosphate isomerase|nr:sugar phosphate isomerase/epimerase [Verrucomicrobiota bacterium]OQB91774.1 MAG: L-ribulose-5-phosphate 3-epimerase UlaE [Verrucomicrobia bacterium ADurb.Bin118]HPY30964.1 sugar phosphate isomerase/epimerase family protein [Verrucomicrobiota bacterium]HQB17423.1 sugar phosphate isomerase/epimerase family protein [Verrucomicrobiota bacterium]
MKRNWKKGFWYGSVPGREPLDKFKALKDAGFHGIEPPMDLDVETLLRARDATGVLIHSVVCASKSRHLASASAADRLAAVEGVKQALREAKQYGAHSVLAVAGGVNEATTYAENYARTQEGFRQAVPLAEELGVKIAFENVWNNFLLSPLEAARYVDEFNSPAVGWQFDVGNVVAFGWPEHWIRILGPRIVHVHIKEFSRKKMAAGGPYAGFNVEFLEGDNDWPAVMKALDDIGYSGWVTVEPAYEPKGVSPEARLRVISEKLDQILAL